MVRNSRRWFWTGVILIGLGLAGGLFFGYQAFQNKITGIFASGGVTDTLIRSFQKLNCP